MAPVRRRLVPLLALALVTPLAVLARWRWAPSAEGPALHPRPDALEYAAAAQSLAQAGRFYLQIGPYRVRPRYPPGWPLLLAPAVRAGVPGEQLWRVTGLHGAALSGLLAAATAGAVLRLRRPRRAAPEALATTAAPAATRSNSETVPAESTALGTLRLDTRIARGALVAGLLAGGGWALAPNAVAVDRTVLSDSPAALASALTLLATAAAFLGETRRRGAAAGAGATAVEVAGTAATAAAPQPRLGLAAAGGLAFGLTVAIRPVSAALLVPALALLAWGGWRASRAGAGADTHAGTWDPSTPGRQVVLDRGDSTAYRAAARRAAAWCAGALVAPLLVAGVLTRSGLRPWRFSGYQFWIPRLYGDPAVTFQVRYALHGNPRFPLGPAGAPIAHLKMAAMALLGLPGLAPDSYVGLVWPAAGWIVLAVLLARACRTGRFGRFGRARRSGNAGPALGAVPAGATLPAPLPSAAAERWTLLALLAWTVAQAGLYALYFYPSARLFLPGTALALALTATGLGLGLSSHRRPRRLAAAAGAVLLALLLGRGFLRFRAEDTSVPPEPDVRAAVEGWLRLSDRERAARTVPFDPVHAQALGLLPPGVVSRIGAWGTLPDTQHVVRLRARRIVP
jgi:hypothetical protein